MMSFILQKRHNECAIAVTRYILDFYSVKGNYEEIKTLMFNNFSLARIKFVLGTFGFHSSCYHSEDKEIEEIDFDIAVIQVKNNFSYHFLCVYRKGDNLKVYNPSVGLSSNYNEKIRKKWTGYILLVFK